jgi:hypothetical protein
MSKNIKFVGHVCPERDICADASNCGFGYIFENIKSMPQGGYLSPFFPIFVTSLNEEGYNICTVREKDE